MERRRDDAGDQSWREQAPTDPARVPHRSICHTNLVTRPQLSAKLLRRLVIRWVIIRMAVWQARNISKDGAGYFGGQAAVLETLELEFWHVSPIALAVIFDFRDRSVFAVAYVVDGV